MKEPEIENKILKKATKFSRSIYYAAINHKQSNKEKEYKYFSKKVLFSYTQAKG